MNKEYFSEIHRILTDVVETQETAMNTLSDEMVKTIITGKNIYVFGCSHASILAQELFYRTGGLAIINPIFAPGLTLTERPITITSQIERIDGYGNLIIKQNGITEGDLVILHSVSGRNPVTIEAGIEAKSQGAYVACVTNMAYTKSVSSRAACGKKLYEVCDCVIDNCGNVGDAVCTIDKLPEKVASSSTVVGTAILNSVVADVVDKLLQKDVVPPVFLSANVEGGDEHNAKILSEYHDRIKYM